MFLKAAKRTPVNLEEWAVSMMERDNRKSHLGSELSPATRSFLRQDSQPSPKESVTSASTASNPAFTPTSGIIPIAEATPITAIQRDSYNDTPQGASFDRQGFPPRTSSNFSNSSSSRPHDGEGFSQIGALPPQPRDSGNFNPITTLPIRPAPPPSGPLPQPPIGNLRNSQGRRPVPNGSAYQYDSQQY